MVQAKPWSLFTQLYWWVTLVVGLGFVLFFAAQANLEAVIPTSFFVLSGLLLYFTLKQKPQLAIALHQFLALLLAVWIQRSQTSVSVGLEPIVELIPTFAVLILLTVGIFLGPWGAGIGLLVYGLLFGYQEGNWVQLVPAVVAAVMAIGMNFQLVRLEGMQIELERLALYDPMTGVLNRRLLQSEYSRYQALAGRQDLPLMLISWDLDGLKQINDTHGHAAGDQAILSLTQALKHSLRQEDVVFRMGGDEFLSLHLDLKRPEEVIERVLSHFQAVSVGWVNAQHLELNTVVSRADAAMYAQKRARKGVRVWN